MKITGGEEVIGKNFMRILWVVLPIFLAAGCADFSAPDGRTVAVPTATPPLEKYEGIGEKRDPVTRVRLGRDVLMPKPLKEDIMPDDIVGPYELRGETLASALQLILDDYDVSIAFETDEGLRKKVTVSNLHGKLRDVVNRVCSLADLYCHFEEGTLTIKNTETFVVDLPPIGTTAAATASTTSTTTTGTTAAATPAATTTGGSGSGAAYTQIATGLAAIIGSTPVIDESTRVMIYTATQRSHRYAMQYFERLRKNTALIIFETHIWEVTLNNENRTGINWSALSFHIGKVSLPFVIPGGAPTGTADPISITPAFTGSGDFSDKRVLEFISERGSVKTISQPQITVLSGASASLAVSQNETIISGIQRTPSTTVGVADTVSTTQRDVSTGLTMNVTSAWDQSTVYGALNITLNDLLRIDEFNPDVNTTIQLPQTTTRSLQTAIRVRPGDAILIGGLVSERDNLSDSGPGFMKPLFPTARTAKKANSELVFLLRPRVVAFDMGDDSDTPVNVDAPKELAATPDITDRVKDVFGQRDVPQTVPVEALPSGISPEAFAPQDPADSAALPTTIISSENAPADPSGKEDPLPLSKAVEGKDKETPAVYRGGMNR